MMASDSSLGLGTSSTTSFYTAGQVEMEMFLPLLAPGDDAVCYDGIVKCSLPSHGVGDRWSVVGQESLTCLGISKLVRQP